MITLTQTMMALANQKGDLHNSLIEVNKKIEELKDLEDSLLDKLHKIRNEELILGKTATIMNREAQRRKTMEESGM